MIKDHLLTEKLIKIANEASNSLHQSLFDVRDVCSQDEYESYRKAIGMAMGSIFIDIVKPLLKEHPDLDPLNKEEPKAASREEDIPAYNPDAPLMIERLYHVTKNGKQFGLTIQFFKPAKSKDAKDWYCQWSINSKFGGTKLNVFGTDAMEAFIKAIQEAETRVKAMIGDANIKWAGGESPGLFEHSNI